MKKNIILLIAFFSIFSLTSLMAQDGIPKEKREKVRQLMVWKLTDRLNLTSEQSQKFFPTFNKYLDGNEKLFDERRNLIHDIKTADNLTDAQLTEKANRILKIDKERNENLIQLVSDSDKILSARQCAELVIFQTEFVKDLARNMERFKKDRK